jgi:hypothetical protein
VPADVTAVQRAEESRPCGLAGGWVGVDPDVVQDKARQIAAVVRAGVQNFG